MQKYLANIESQVNEINGKGDLQSDVGTILGIIVYGIGIIAVIVVIIGGIYIMMSQGDPGKVKRGKDTVLYCVIGLIVVLCAWAIVKFVLGIF